MSDTMTANSIGGRRMFWMETLDGGKWLQTIEELPGGVWPIAVWKSVPPGSEMMIEGGLASQAMMLEGRPGRLYRLVKETMASDWPTYREVAA